MPLNPKRLRQLCSLTALTLLASCTTLPPPTAMNSLSLSGADISKIADEMVTDILSSSSLLRAGSTPRIILDKQYLKNSGYQVIDKGIIINKLRAGLLRRTEGRLSFVCTGMASDYILSGSIQSVAAANPSTGTMLRYHQFSFEIMEINSGSIIWSGMYETERKAVENEIYR